MEPMIIILSLTIVIIIIVFIGIFINIKIAAVTNATNKMEEKLDGNKESTTNQLSQLNDQLTRLQERTSNLRDLEGEVNILNKILERQQQHRKYRWA